MTIFYPGLGLQAPVASHDNNGILLGQPPKDINSEGGGDYALARHVYFRQYPNAFPIAFPNEKRWIPNGNRDASSIASKRRAIQVGKTSVVSGLHSYQTHSIEANRNTILEAKNRCRNQGYRAPPKIAASPSNTTTCYIGLPQVKTMKHDACTYQVFPEYPKAKHGFWNSRFWTR